MDYKRLNDGNFDQNLGDDFNSKPGDLYMVTNMDFGGELDRNPWGASDNKQP